MGLGSAYQPNAATSSKHRKSVLHDFSIVEKASIKILKAKNLYMMTADETLTQENELYVQINPTEFSYSCQTPRSNVSVGVKSVASNKAFKQKVLRDSAGTEGSDEIPLVYDIYDEYNIRTSKGLVPSNNFSLMNEEVTSLPALIWYVEHAPYYGYFVWGDIKIFGLLSSIRVDYRAFSRWGQPLKANATLRLVIQQLPGKNGPNIAGIGAIASGVAASANKAATLAGSAGSTKEMIGNLFRMGF